jgi:hypothetical protein
MLLLCSECNCCAKGNAAAVRHCIGELLGCTACCCVNAAAVQQMQMLCEEKCCCCVYAAAVQQMLCEENRCCAMGCANANAAVLMEMVSTMIWFTIPRAGQNRISAPHMTVCMVISLLKLPYVHRIYPEGVN